MGEVGEKAYNWWAMGEKATLTGKKKVSGKLHRVPSDGETIVFQTSHGEFTWNLSPKDNGERIFVTPGMIRWGGTEKSRLKRVRR